MAHTLTEADNFPATITVPDGGDPRTAASVEVFAQGLADRSRWGRNRGLGLTSGYKYTVPLKPIGSTGVPPTSQWVHSTASPAGWQQVDTAVSLLIPLWVGQGTLSKITAIEAAFRPATGHGGTIGDIFQPALALRSQTGFANHATVQSVTHAAASYAAYEGILQTLTLTLSAGGHVIVPDDNYYALFTGESGAQFAAGLALCRISVTLEPV